MSITQTNNGAGLEKMLLSLAGEMSKNDLRAAAGAGAAEIRKEMKLNAERIRVSGTLARSIYQKQIREKSDQFRQVFYIGPRKGKKHQRVGKKGVNKDAFYAQWVEFGHYTAERQDGKGSPKWVPPSPFMRPAVISKQRAAGQAVGAKLRERLAQRTVK